MIYNTIIKSELWYPKYSGTSNADYTVSTAYEELNYKDLERWHTDVSAHTGFCFDTLNPYDCVDCIYVPSDNAYSVELKGIAASSTERRYAVSQLFEENKRACMMELWKDKGLLPLYVRYYDDDAVIVPLYKIDFTDYVEVNNPADATDNKAIFQTIEDYGKMGILVRCRNWFATANTVQDRNRKIRKDIWFIPNERGRWKNK